MIGLDEARERVDRRLEPLVDERGQSAVENVGLACPGTDVLGPDLEDELERCRAEFVSYMARGDQLGGVLNGLLFRTFWLGFEYGRASE